MAFGASTRDRALLAVAGMALMYVMGGVLWYMALTDKASGWNRSQSQYKNAHRQYTLERKLISEKYRWNDAYEEEREKMPMFPEGEAVDTHWLNRMDQLAEKYHIAISTRQPGQEVAVGDVFELPIDVKSWEGGLEPLVQFLFALEHAPEAMFDVKALLLRPSSHKGFLKGQFTLNCAYMRGDVEEEEAEADEKPAAKKGEKAVEKDSAKDSKKEQK